jgi:hypothetical protein
MNGEIAPYSKLDDFLTVKKSIKRLAFIVE